MDPVLLADAPAPVPMRRAQSETSAATRGTITTVAKPPSRLRTAAIAVRLQEGGKDPRRSLDVDVALLNSRAPSSRAGSVPAHSARGDVHVPHLLRERAAVEGLPAPGVRRRLALHLRRLRANLRRLLPHLRHAREQYDLPRVLRVRVVCPGEEGE